jgi:acyl carrier protein
MTILEAMLNEIRPEADFAASADFLADGLLDSFDLLMLVADLDRRFGISILGTEIVPEHFRNLQTIEALLARHGVSA